MNKHVFPEGNAISNAISMAFTPNPEAFSDAARHSAKVMEDLVRSWQAIGEKGLAHSATNACAMLEALKAIASAKSVPDALRLQTEFLQKQLSTAIGQGQEVFALSSKSAQEAFQAFTGAAAATLTARPRS